MKHFIFKDIQHIVILFDMVYLLTSTEMKHFNFKDIQHIVILFDMVYFISHGLRIYFDKSYFNVLNKLFRLRTEEGTAHKKLTCSLL